jgi:hypothetical protein
MGFTGSFIYFPNSVLRLNVLTPAVKVAPGVPAIMR